MSVPVIGSARSGELEPYDLGVLIAQITDLHVSEPGSLIQEPEHVIEIPAVVGDWDATRAYLVSRSPMPKTGSVMG